jgi:polar amino acid transport system permease protein
MLDLLGLLSYGPTGWGDELLSGTFLTVKLALATLPVGLLLGFLIALAKRSRSTILRGFGEAFTTVFRALPELLTLFIVAYGGQMLVQWAVRFFTDASVVIPSFLAGMIALGLVFAAYASEVFRAAFNGIPHGQWEGAAAIGLHRWQTLLLVIAPQLLRLALPGLANLWLVLLKDTALCLRDRLGGSAAHDVSSRRQHQGTVLLLFRGLHDLPGHVDLSRLSG